MSVSRFYLLCLLDADNIFSHGLAQIRHNGLPTMRATGFNYEVFFSIPIGASRAGCSMLALVHDSSLPDLAWERRKLSKVGTCGDHHDFVLLCSINAPQTQSDTFVQDSHFGTHKTSILGDWATTTTGDDTTRRRRRGRRRRQQGRRRQGRRGRRDAGGDFDAMRAATSMLHVHVLSFSRAYRQTCQY